MINVVITRDQTGPIRSIEISGHSGYAEAGSDIICSAAAAIGYTAAGGLESLAGLRGCYKTDDGYMLIRLPEQMDEKQRSIASIIMETAAIGFKQMEFSYAEYVSVKDEEVRSDD
ncbi:MAG TPA: ribosomal-processing cysteine protease Prp [Clostridiales bacterium]|nr:ribosomal-processing cysteine protease Prp [Clostridiales bacterium]HOL92645.1 ribosomal-processing cysteine protease Prp [Clostridiales bacterium]HPP36627.1 ribosomal-processing cysteine protease Prp [Clostridiales bacterium]